MSTISKSLFLTLMAGVMTLTGCKKEASVSLETVKIGSGDLTETVTATGTVESVTQVDVGTQVTGIISHLYADFNSEVKQGELIAELEKTVLQSEVTSAEASVQAAKLTYDYNMTNYKRDKALHDRQLISDYEYQTSLKELEVSKTAYDKALADKVRAAKNLNYAEIYSPIDGIVISRDVEVGQTVVSNMSVANLYTIADLDNMQVIGNVDEADIGQVKVGQNVTFTVDAYPEDEFHGQVKQVRLSATTESNVVTYEVVVSAQNPDHKLIPGLTANLSIYVTEETGVMLLPAAAFTFKPDSSIKGKNIPVAGEALDPASLAKNQKSVWVVSGDKLINKAVTIGESNGIKTVITAGLNQGDLVATGYNESAVESEQATTQRSPFAPGPRGKK